MFYIIMSVIFLVIGVTCSKLSNRILNSHTEEWKNSGKEINNLFKNNKESE